jgi:hypothetical protein
MSVAIESTVDLDELEAEANPIKNEERLEAVKDSLGDRLTERHVERGEPPRHADEITPEKLLDFAERQSENRVDQSALKELQDELAGVPKLSPEELAEKRKNAPPPPKQVPRPAPASTPRDDGLPADPVERHQKIAADFVPFQQAAAQELATRQQQLLQAYQHAQKVGSVDPAAGQRILAQVGQGVQELNQMGAELQQVTGRAESLIYEASAEAAIGTRNPTQVQINQLCDFAVDELGIPAQAVPQLAMIPQVAAMVSKLYNQSRQTAQTASKRKRGQRSKKQFTSAISQRLSKMEAVAKRHGRHVRGMAR